MVAAGPEHGALLSTDSFSNRKKQKANKIIHAGGTWCQPNDLQLNSIHSRDDDSGILYNVNQLAVARQTDNTYASLGGSTCDITALYT